MGGNQQQNGSAAGTETDPAFSILPLWISSLPSGATEIGNMRYAVGDRGVLE
jgi:hypothetical protein